MALQMDISLNSGVVITSAYIKIIQVSASSKHVSMIIRAFKDQDAMNKGFPEIEGYGRTISFVPQIGAEKGDFITQGYMHLKTLDEYKSAADV